MGKSLCRHYVRWLGLTTSLVFIAALLGSGAVWAGILKLSPAQPGTADVSDFQFSPDGRYVVYTANPRGYNEVFSVPAGGGTPIRLNLDPENPPFQAGGARISPDSQWVVYGVAVKSGAGFLTPGELFRVPITGPYSDSVKLNSPLVSGGNTLGFRISPDGQFVIYRADQITDTVAELWSVPLDASAPAVKLSGPLTPNGNVTTEFQISPDGSHVVYVADQDTDEVFELYSVPVAGPAASGTKLNGSLVSGGDVGIAAASSYFVISPDGTRVVYLADQDTNGLPELYSVPVDGSAGAVKLSPTPIGSQGVSPVFSVSADSSRVIFRAGDAATGRTDLYSVPIAGPASAGLQLNDPAIEPRSVGAASLLPGGNLVFFYVVQPVSGYTGYVVPLAGPASAMVKLAETFDAAQSDPAAHFWVYNRLAQVFAVPLTGPASAAVQLNAFPIGGSQGYSISPDGGRLVYFSLGELYSVPLTGVYSDSVKISGPLTAGGTVQYYAGFRFSPDSGQVVYRADAEQVGVIELYATDAGRLSTPQRVFLPLIAH